ncbi:hypothetical protein CVU76_01445 [Candidatus Dojkabacteria bacterium HGW-Dojkabacteria-1]|uniref:Uncharacterized protein n=1 Tax=Candidatus Dojkabacteria bacterium HGW-Dojkabacteria-1 TaxID=2013761 RepID=A0A2N2F387_9BACT|nr:MAG: hypothetical protein CVU76_01445 [Candidatus Dojkabacteria bacterium HGW-Dojkabacteria-1]
MKRSIFTLITISFLFGIFDFHYQNTISPIFSKIFGNSNNPLQLIPLFIYMLLPWYLLSLYVYIKSKKEKLISLKILTLRTILAYLISVISYYLHYVFLLFFVGLPNFENMVLNFSIQNIRYAFIQLFLPGVIEWSIGAIVLGLLISVFNYFVIPTIRRFTEKEKKDIF